MLQSMELKRVRHNLVTEQQQIEQSREVKYKGMKFFKQWWRITTSEEVDLVSLFC